MWKSEAIETPQHILLKKSSKVAPITLLRRLLYHIFQVLIVS